MTVRDLIDRYNLYITTSPTTGKECVGSAYAERIRRDGAADEIRAKKQEIMDALKADRAEKERQAVDRAARVAAIEGLTEIRAAIDDLESWQYEFDKSFDDVGGLGVRPRPQYDIAAMKAKYPRAAAYLRAEEESLKTNTELAAIGRKALENVIFGDWQEAMATMDAEIDAFVKRHAWD